MSLELSFHGAVGSVTGSSHMLKAGGLTILVDCGLFQGEGQWRNKNLGDFGFRPEDIDVLLLTHGHLDHCGRIPLLVKRGFRGRIICTPATHDISRIVILDSAHIQEEDFEHWRKINIREGYDPKPPIYTTLDALDAMGYFEPIARYGQPIVLNDDVTVTFRDAGHILGAAFIEVDVKGEGRVVYSGDLGNRNKPIIRDPQFTKDADIIVLESTYGNRDHKGIEASIEELLAIITDTFDRGGNVLIPSFAVERSQELLFILRTLHEQKRLPHCQVFLDTPMGIDVTNIMRRHPECYDEHTRALFAANKDPFDFPGLLMSKTQSSSRYINSVRSNAIIIAGSGMCTGGRIRLHMRHNIWREESSIVFIGYQAKGTLGRELVDGETRVQFFGETFRVNSSVHTLGGFSSHADRGILFDWLSKNESLKQVFLVHGEASVVETLKGSIEERSLAQSVVIPQIHTPYVI